ncbi:1-phosphofructokinase [Mycobacterium sp. 21AC1]|uniref:1-phosphofructokinase n=1 Tax=[Mycobacterium] appelbergii TaxID=2939269 RepID=UPI002938DBE7|nr:1-phosphofructokinase [Mycobacterium sp. 21AC1]MDV3126484.1 1-phosphofructokinase [Mycobacterium sp. 21AC1]
MIVTVTPNPSVDRTVVVDHLNLGEVNRGRRSWSEPSGKGVNVALALHAHRVPVRAVVTAGGPVGAQLRQMLGDTGLSTVIVSIAGDIRSNISLTQPDGTVTKINEPGPHVDTEERDRVLAAVAGELADASWLVCAGSLARGMPADWYGELVALGAARGVRVAIDSSGAPLAGSLAAKPALVKPNLDELADLTGTVPTTLGGVIAAAHEIRRRGARTVLASLGADGAILVDGAGVLWGQAPVVTVVSTVGAGDAMLAGYLSCPGDRSEALATALQWGAAAVQHEGTLLPMTTGRAAVTITDAVDPTRPLGGAAAARSSGSCL